MNSEQLSVQAAVLDGLGDVVFGDGFGGVEVGDRAGDAEDFVVGAGAEAELVDGLFEDSAGAFASGAMLAHGFRVEVGVANECAVIARARRLRLPVRNPGAVQAACGALVARAAPFMGRST